MPSTQPIRTNRILDTNAIATAAPCIKANTSCSTLGVGGAPRKTTTLVLETSDLSLGDVVAAVAVLARVALNVRAACSGLLGAAAGDLGFYAGKAVV